MTEIIFAIGLCWAVDGDTLRCPVPIRIWGLDCPEIGTRQGGAARRAAAMWLARNKVACADTRTVSRARKVYRCDAFARHMIGTGLCTEWCRFSGGAYGGTTCTR